MADTTATTDTATADAAAATATTAAAPAATTDAAPDILADPKVAALVKGLRDEAAKARIAGNEFKTASEARMKAVAQALGLGDETPDPVKLQAALTAKDSELRQLRTEGKVRSLASKLTADAEALLDSRSFVKAISELDPTAADFEASVSTAMADALAANPKLKIAAPGAPRGGAEIAPAGPVKTFSRAQLKDSAFYLANEKDIDAAWRSGRITE